MSELNTVDYREKLHYKGITVSLNAILGRHKRPP